MKTNKEKLEEIRQKCIISILTEYGMKYVPKSSLEIIGRDIRLPDVLKLLNNNQSFSTQDRKWTDFVVELLLLWDPEKPLHLQKQEVIDYLYELLIA